jgi:hypothetical protein
MTRTVIATKKMNGRLVERQFTEHAWELAGNDKNGWELKPDLNAIATIPLPTKGETEKPKIEKPAQVLPVKSEVAQEVKNQFMTLAAKLSKGVIKDYFDRESIVYSNTANIIDIRTQLGNEMNYNIEKLNAAFNDSQK